MLARSLSVVLSILAALLLGLAYLLGWQSPSDTLREPGVARVTASGTEQERRALCNALDEQILGCQETLSAYLAPAIGPSDYPEKVRRLLAIKRRHALEREALRGCLGAPDAPPEGAALTRCVGRPTCDAFAECVASIYP